MKVKVFLFIFFTLQIYHVKSQVYDFGNVTAGELSDTINNGVSAKILYKKIDYIYGQVFEIHVRIKIYNSDGFKYANWEIPYKYVRSLKAATYNLENNEVIVSKVTKEGIFKDKVTKNYQIKKVLFPNIKEGSILEIKYRVKEISINAIYIQNYIPIDLFIAEIRNPYHFELNIKENPYAKMPISLSNVNGKIIYKGKNIPPLKKEDFVGNIYNHCGQILIYSNYYFSSWEKIIGFLYHYEWFGKQLRKNNNFFKEDIDYLIATEKDSLEKAKKIYKFVKDKMLWNKHNGLVSKGIKKAYKDKEGNIADINLMLIAMLNYIGLKAHAMVLSSKENGWILYPGIQDFDVVIGALEIESEIYLLDASNDNGGFGEIPINFNNGNALVIYDDGTTLNYSTMTKDVSKNKNIANVSLDLENIEAFGSVKSQKTNYFAWKFRDLYKNSEESSYQKHVESGGLLKINTIIKENLFDLNMPIIVSYDFTLEDYIEEINNKYYFEPLLFFGKKKNDFIKENREYPIDLDFPYEEIFVINIEIPEGYKVESLPENKNIEIEYKLGSLIFKIENTKKQIQVFFKITINKAVILPQYYSSLFELFREYTTISNSKVVLSKI
ncbi:MAG: DUF3858 domain-containing protein [Flavobacteriaceae bacterium]